MRVVLFCIMFLPFISLSQVQEGVLLDHWKNDDIPGSAAYDNAYNEVWGFVINGREYGVMGSTLGTHFFDVTNASAIEEVDFVEGGTTGPVIIHRDYHDYKGFLYAVSDEGSNSTLQIIDLTTLPDSVSVVYDSNILIKRAHNIFIDSSRAKLYAMATAHDNTYSALRVFSLEDPINPSLIQGFGSNIGGEFVGHVHDGFVAQDTAYLNCGPDGLLIVDFTNTEEPALLNDLETWEYSQSGYNHSGWPSEGGKFYYMADENWDKDMKVLDMSNFPEINVAGFFDADNEDSYSIPHNQIVHEDYLYVSHYFDGLQVYDISNPLTPVRVMYYPTSNLAPIKDYKGAWGVFPFLPSGNILVSDMQEGFFVIEKFKPISHINDDDLIEIEITPNPVSNIFRINYSDNLNISEIELLDMEGKNVQRWSNQNFTDDLKLDKKVANGTYFLKIDSQNGSVIKKISVIQ